ncbi:alanine--tRNA ligase [Patescibacteria group bacterium]|nr:alanine--tRNA ligase [Patescibacteria group bacterium]
MTSKEIRNKFLRFFEKKGHKIVPSSSLLPIDPSVLFTTAGMQQFKEYFLGKPSPYGNRVTSSQKCFRTSDIEEVGDTTHLTFLEMLGNFSFAVSAEASGEGGEGYFKKESIEWALEFLTKDCKLKKEKLWITVFKGDKEVPKDKESREIWKELGFPKEKIHGFSREDNFWGPTGEEGPCGPTTEIHYELSKKPCSLGKKCLPNCKCGRFIELWNLVFNEFYQDRDKKLTPLKQKGVDTGMGLERLVMVIQEKPSVFETDLFSTMPQNQSERIIADHIKGSVFLASEGIIPLNVEQGYVLRRILRRAIRHGKILKMPKNFLIPLVQKVIEIYKEVYPEVKSKETDILTIIQNEEEKFAKTLEQGLKEFDKLISKNKDIKGEEAFNLYQSYGFPLELTEELVKEKGFKIDKRGFEKAIKKHQEISRAGAEKKFGGVGKDAGLEETKLHTATHLMHQALREVLGDHVKQMGSDITSQRLRFDFSHIGKMTEQEINKVEEIVNQEIKQDLEVKKEEMNYKDAIDSGALAFFREKYPEKVSVYSMGEFSKEICAGPHVKRTSELGKFKIIKEESSGAGIRRLRAILE